MAERLKQFAAALLELPEDRREAAARALCGDDPAMLALLLQAVDASAQDALAARLGLNAARGAAEAPTRMPSHDEQAGATIGAYRLLERLGEGGFGEVFAAEQAEPIRRRVALKIIKQGMDSRAVVARFEAERQALAMMDHPNIAKVFDAGTTTGGRPYFVMELVRGVAITTYCEEARLSPRERIELMIPVCRAIQHAHQKGIIHRDIKPSNVLVTILDGKPVPKVIDFGIAKAIAGATTLTDKTVYTAFRQFIGTPAYMSPEQLLMSGMDVDTRSDVYALGVLMYELLSGSLPFDTESLLKEGLERMQQVVREQDPPKPSTRVMTLDAGRRTSVAAARRLGPEKLGGVLRGEVDWMVMKAVEKDRGRRYQSPTELADDLLRYLRGEAVRASPPSGWYRARKFTRRHRALLTGIGAVMAALMIGLVAFAWQARVANRQRDLAVAAQQAEAAERTKAEAERTKASIIAEFMSETLRGAGPSVARGRDTTMLKEMMRVAADRIERGDLAANPDAELRLRSTIGNTYRAIAAFDEAQRLLAPAVDLSRATHAGDHPATVAALLDLTELLLERGDYAGPKPVLTEALETSRRLEPQGSAETARALGALSMLTHRLGDPAGAELLAREAIGILRRLSPQPKDALVNALEALGEVLRDRGNVVGAEALVRESLAIRRELAPGDDPGIATTLNNLSTLRTDQHDLDGAEALARESLEMYRRLYKDGHPDLAVALNTAGFLRQLRGDFVAAERWYREALAMRRALYPDGHASIAIDLNNIGDVLQKRGDLDGAESNFRESLEMQRRLFPGDYIDVAFTLNALAGVRRARGDLDGAVELLRECLAMRRRLHPGDHPTVAVTLDNLALLMRQQGDVTGSEPLVLEALAMKRRTVGDDHPLTLISLSSLGSLYAAQGRHEEVIATLTPVIEKARATFPGANAPRAITMMSLLAESHAALAEKDPEHPSWAEAESAFMRAHADAVASLGESSAVAAQVRTKLAAFYARWDAADPGKGRAAEAAKWGAAATPAAPTP
jgi:eukaryotic-like serine/threonine-protein kinase